MIVVIAPWAMLATNSAFSKKLGPHHRWMRAPGKKRRRNSMPRLAPASVRRRVSAATGTTAAAATRIATAASTRTRTRSAAGRTIAATTAGTAVLGRAGPAVLWSAVPAPARAAVLGRAGPTVLRSVVATAARLAIRGRAGLRSATVPHHRRVYLNASARTPIRRRELRAGRRTRTGRAEALPAATFLRIAAIRSAAVRCRSALPTRLAKASPATARIAASRWHA
jgi:hypothetical protein